MIKKRIRQIIHGVSLVLGVLILLLWGWSYVEYDGIVANGRNVSAELLSVEGRILWDHAHFRRNRPAIQWIRNANYIDWDSRPTWLARRGFHFYSYDHLRSVSAAVPHWFAAMLFLFVGFQGRIQAMLLTRLPPVARSKRPRLLASIRLLRIAIATAIAVTLVFVLCSRFTFADLGDALVATPGICGLFLIVPLIGIWLVRKPLRAHRDRLLIHRDRYLCTACGYNLTANTTGICPECGTASTRLKKKLEGEPGA